MAALRGASSLLSNGRVLLGNPNPNPNANSRALLLLPSQFVSSRGIASKLFVGGLSFYATEEALSEAFSQYGQVIEAKIIMDGASERSKGFGFVTFASQDEAQKARTEMNGKVLNGRVVFVDNAKAKLRFSEALPIARGPPEPSGNK
ncbi:glycine-rich RNA-binding protein 4, mitochondrial-like [Cocos nucifera]|uniref:Glycine-rich RNA-binding protein 4, mitochondrial-like n=1 Tax=Cocos nucifera TaxID=13894 RepID=A0A8K0I045_COCNU|nr:glycine-rich RNA-binding protein 4, mitochondrial-like [Cocos nucifera]